MNKIRALALTGLLAVAAPSAYAIPFGVDIVGLGGGSWNLDGPTDLTRNWSAAPFAPYSADFDIAAGDYSWSINGLGVLGASWSLSLNNEVVYSGSDHGLVFKIRDNYQFEAVPEPATLGLFGLGLLAAGFAARRRAQ